MNTDHCLNVLCNHFRMIYELKTNRCHYVPPEHRTMYVPHLRLELAL